MHFAIFASFALWVRAVVEMAIIVRFHLQQYPTQRDTALARDTVYGLFTFIFLFLILYVHTESSRCINRPPLLVTMQDDLRRYIIDHIQDHVDAGGRPPALRPLFDDLRHNPTSALSAETAQTFNQVPDGTKSALLNPYKEYMEDLDARYGNLTHISLAREH
jgi:hypothetical protein